MREGRQPGTVSNGTTSKEGQNPVLARGQRAGTYQRHGCRGTGEPCQEQRLAELPRAPGRGGVQRLGDDGTAADSEAAPFISMSQALPNQIPTLLKTRWAVAQLCCPSAALRECTVAAPSVMERAQVSLRLLHGGHGQSHWAGKEDSCVKMLHPPGWLRKSSCFPQRSCLLSSPAQRLGRDRGETSNAC